MSIIQSTWMLFVFLFFLPCLCACLKQIKVFKEDTGSADDLVWLAQHVQDHEPSPWHHIKSAVEPGACSPSAWMQSGVQTHLLTGYQVEGQHGLHKTCQKRKRKEQPVWYFQRKKATYEFKMRSLDSLSRTVPVVQLVINHSISKRKSEQKPPFNPKM